jgi:N-acetylglucosamine-6-sulfatase
MVGRGSLAAVGLALACATTTEMAAAAQGVPATEPAPTPDQEPSAGSAVRSTAGSDGAEPATAPRPNIVLLYLDDLNPVTDWLWSDARRTPLLARFRAHGVEFQHAVGTTPLCGPSRATLLTGQYGHQDGVTDNKMDGFDPGTTLATELQAADYHTVFVGKYLNGIESVAPTRPSVQPFAQGWDRFDILWNRRRRGQGQFYDYTLWTKHGVKIKRARPRDHSTLIVGARVAKHIRKAPPDQPIFAVASLAAGHWPNSPLDRYRGARSCRRVRPYTAPSIDERNVSDKPAYIRRLPSRGRNSIGLRANCEEMLGVEDALARIVTALRKSGRLDDTLLLFTADNGYLMGDHRMPGHGGKKWPYAVEVPLYALWPARLGSRHRTVSEPVSTADLPVTICALAGCRLPGAVGLDLTPLLTGAVRSLDRSFVYIEMLHRWKGMPPWYGLVTTREYATDAIWQYVEYAGGQRELYDLVQDPYRLRNRVADPTLAARVEDLQRLLHASVVDPDGVTLP